ncbi:ParB/RepB/Spo0J family partition protein [Gammaproteobacteria bacterium]|nr:ParB/RepB/Spo0J family partition protein [Gammaproteobacteria bacterium]
MSDKKALNRGLDALLGSTQGAQQRTIKEIQIAEISPGRFQPRQDFNEEKIAELSSSIKKHGVISPILVREVGLNAFEVIAGERRLRASKMAGLASIPCLVDQKEDQNALEAALIENLQREDLNSVEEARGYDRLKREFGLTQEEVASATGKARSTIANSLRLLALPNPVLELLSQGSLEKGHAKLLVSLDPNKALNLAKQIINSNLTVREAQNLTSKKPSKTSTKTKSKDLLNIEQEMSEGFGHRVEIDAKNKKTGKVLIHYSTAEELENIISKLV